MPPRWLTSLSWLSLVAAAAAVVDIVVDMYGRGRRQDMRIMEPVWVITALYAPGLANVAYRRWVGCVRPAGGTSKI